jgi:hypothetical protein
MLIEKVELFVVHSKAAVGYGKSIEFPLLVFVKLDRQFFTHAQICLSDHFVAVSTLFFSFLPELPHVLLIIDYIEYVEDIRELFDQIVIVIVGRICLLTVFRVNFQSYDSSFTDFVDL